MRTLLLLTLAPAAAWHALAPPRAPSRLRFGAPARMDSSWRPKSVDPLGQAWGAPKEKERRYVLWLDLRYAEVTFAQQALVQLFYAVRRVVDEAGKSLPRGAAVQGLLYDESRYDRADTIGSDVPIYLETAGGLLVNATSSKGRIDLPAELRAPTEREQLRLAEEELNGLSDDAVTTAIALPADAMLWAEALTGLDPDKLKCVDEGA